MKEPKDLKVAELRDELQSRGLSTKGLKKDLVERLEEAMNHSQPTVVSEPDHTPPTEEPVSPVEASVPFSQNDHMTAVAEEDQNLDIETPDFPLQNGAPFQTKIPLPLTFDKPLSDKPVYDGHHTMEKQITETNMDSHHASIVLDKKPELGTLVVDYGEEDSEEVDIMSQNLSANPSTKRKDNTTVSSPDHAKKFKMDVPHSAVTNGHAIGGEILHISELVRPFTVNQLQSFLETFGSIEDLWMNSIKSQCYVKYSNKDQLLLAQAGLDGQLWPKDTGKHLKVTFAERTTVLQNIQQEHERTGTGHKLGFTDVKTEAPHKSSETASNYELDHAKASKASHSTLGPLPIEEKMNLSLTDIFKLTATEPPLYYLPRADEKSDRRTDRRGHIRSHSRH